MRVRHGPSSGTLIAAGDSIDFTEMPDAYRPKDPSQITSPIDVVVKRAAEDGFDFKAINITNPGESTASALDRSKPSNGAWAQDARGNWVTTHALHVPYEINQIDELVKLLEEHPDTRGVIYGNGANDLLLLQDAAKKSKNTTLYEVTHLPGTLLEAGKNLRTAVRRMREVYDGPIYLQAPYSPDYGNKINDAALVALLEVTKAVAREESKPGKPVVVLDTYHSFEKAAQQTPGGEKALLWTNPDGTSNIHANLAGQQVLADTILKGVEQYS